MYLIESYYETNKNELKSFVNNVDKNYKSDILKNMVVLKKENEILGSISYQKIGMNGLIRYFVINDNIDYKVIKNMVDKMSVTAKEDNIESLVVVVDDLSVASVFEIFGFELNEDEQEDKFLMIRNCS